MKGITCEICPHACSLEENATGFCRARINKGGRIQDKNYGLVTSLSLDPIEKKPFCRFKPGSLILSVGSFGCNFRCPFCQNYGISMSDGNMDCIYMPPEALAGKAVKAVPRGNIGLAFTYNEPLVGYEYVRDCARLNKENGLLNAIVTNGYINEKSLSELLPFIDAMNIDLKSFNEDFYKKIGGELEIIKRNIAMCAERCHVEVTTLIVPDENDSPEEMRGLSLWLSSVSPKIPLHISRFFPRYRMTEKSATPVSKINLLTDIAHENLQYVYRGNC